MTTTVLHQPRVAWDGARAFVRAAMSPAHFDAFARQVRDDLGPDLLDALEDTYARVAENLERTGGDRYVLDVEAGKWRIRLEELLRTRPDLAGRVVALSRLL
jgi:hypothetical protein